MCPVGAVSKMITSNFVPSFSPDTKRENSSNDAISVVHAPERSSRIFFISSFEEIPSKGPVTLLRYSSAEFSGSIFIAKRLLIPYIGIIFSSTGLSNTSFRLYPLRIGLQFSDMEIKSQQRS